MTAPNHPPKHVGIAGWGAIGGTVGRALIAGISGYKLAGYSDLTDHPEIPAPRMMFQELAAACDLVIEALPAAIVPEIAAPVMSHGKDMILISSAALLIDPNIAVQNRASKGRIFVPSGALAGFDGVRAMRHLGITRAILTTTKPAHSLRTAPYIVAQNIDVTDLREKKRVFSGSAQSAAMAFPANVNVAATLSLCGIGAERTEVEIWADPHTTLNTHDIRVESAFSTLTVRIENTPDPANPKSSLLAAQSIISLLHGLQDPLVVL
jgi:aspartate dehydrogenase